MAETNDEPDEEPETAPLDGGDIGRLSHEFGTPMPAAAASSLCPTCGRPLPGDDEACGLEGSGDGPLDDDHGEEDEDDEDEG